MARKRRFWGSPTGKWLKMRAARQKRAREKLSPQQKQGYAPPKKGFTPPVSGRRKGRLGRKARRLFRRRKVRA